MKSRLGLSGLRDMTFRSLANTEVFGSGVEVMVGMVSGNIKLEG